MAVDEIPRMKVQIHRKIHEAYDESDLDRVLYFNFKVMLETIASRPAKFEKIVFEVVLWADQQGRLLDLIRAEVLEGKARAAAVACRFDYKALSDGSVRKVGTPVRLHATDWRLDACPPSAAENSTSPDVPPPTLDELDDALVRLERPFGDEAADPGGGDMGPWRSWLVVPEAAPGFLPHDPLMIAQHPDGRPLKLAVVTDSVLRVNENRTRVRYATNTEPGWSGSPVFDLE